MDGAWGEIGLLAVTSRAEGLPLVVLEAMARGVPVACFAIAALPEVIEDGVTGCIVSAGDVPALAHAVRRWLGADRAALSAAARRPVAERFGLKAGVAAIRAVYARSLRR